MTTTDTVPPGRERLAFRLSSTAFVAEALAILTLVALSGMTGARHVELVLGTLIGVVLVAPVLGCAGFFLATSVLSQGSGDRTRAHSATVLGILAVAGPWILGSITVLWFLFGDD